MPSMGPKQPSLPPRWIPGLGLGRQGSGHGDSSLRWHAYRGFGRPDLMTCPYIGWVNTRRAKGSAAGGRGSRELTSRTRGGPVPIGVKRMGIERSSTLPPRPAKLGEVGSRSEAGEGHFGRTPHPNLLLGRPRRRGRIFSAERRSMPMGPQSALSICSRWVR
jgi:hypothetical protein